MKWTDDTEESMSYIKKTVLILLAAVGSLLFTNAQAAEICECGFIVGGDYLYWSPCVSNMHYLAEGESVLTEENNVVNYHFIDSDWDPGFRLFLGKEDLFGCFDVMAIYTNFNSTHTAEHFNNNPILNLTWPTPLPIDYGRYATAYWKIELQRVELIAGYSIEFGRGCGLMLKPYAGVDYASIKQNRIDEMLDVLPDDTQEVPVVPTLTNTITRSIDYKGVGPMVGIGYDFDLCEGLTTFGKASLSLLVGEADLNDTQENFDGQGADPVTTIIEENYKDKCFCVPCAHLQVGLGYRALVCNRWLHLRIGYEYLQYMDAPSFLLYNTENPGTFTGLNNNSVTFQGFFGGVAYSF